MGRQIVGALGVQLQMFGRFGRAKLRPFSRRQHEHGRVLLNHQPNLTERRRIISKSDGEGSEAGVGVASWESGTQVVRAGVLLVPEQVRILWDRQKNLGRFNDIFEIEAVGFFGFARELPRPVPWFSVASLGQ